MTQNRPNKLKALLNKRTVYFFLLLFLISSITACTAEPPKLELTIEQITSGDKHHFFGYIGQCRTIPFNASNRYILALEIDHIDRLPTPEEYATVILVDTQNDNKIIRLEKSHAWNPQQGTMFYWNPQKPETQFFFNDRDIKTGKVFTVLYDIEKKKRIRQYKFDDTPVGNGGVRIGMGENFTLAVDGGTSAETGLQVYVGLGYLY